MKKAFTLIELLVVVAIIGILASVVIVNLNSARQKARDARRMSDVRQMASALNLFFDGKNHYPYSTDGLVIQSGSECSHENVSAEWSSLQTLLSPYITTLPKDPTNLGKRYCNGDINQTWTGARDKTTKVRFGNDHFQAETSLEQATGNGDDSRWEDSNVGNSMHFVIEM